MLCIFKEWNSFDGQRVDHVFGLAGRGCLQKLWSKLTAEDEDRSGECVDFLAILTLRMLSGPIDGYVRELCRRVSVGSYGGIYVLMICLSPVDFDFQ